MIILPHQHQKLKRIKEEGYIDSYHCYYCLNPLPDQCNTRKSFQRYRRKWMRDWLKNNCKACIQRWPKIK